MKRSANRLRTSPKSWLRTSPKFASVRECSRWDAWRNPKRMNLTPRANQACDK